MVLKCARIDKCFMPSMVEIDSMVLQKKILRFLHLSISVYAMEALRPMSHCYYVNASHNANP